MVIGLMWRDGVCVLSPFHSTVRPGQPFQITLAPTYSSVRCFVVRKAAMLHTTQSHTQTHKNWVSWGMTSCTNIKHHTMRWFQIPKVNVWRLSLFRVASLTPAPITRNPIHQSKSNMEIESDSENWSPNPVKKAVGIHHSSFCTFSLTSLTPPDAHARPPSNHMIFETN